MMYKCSQQASNMQLQSKTAKDQEFPKIIYVIEAEQYSKLCFWNLIGQGISAYI